MDGNEARTRRLQRHCIEAFDLLYGADPSLGPQRTTVGDAAVYRWTAVPIPLFNRAIGLGDDGEPSDADLDRILDLYRQEGLEGMIQLSPLADRASLGRRLEQRGLVRQPSWATLAMTPDRLQANQTDPAISIEPVNDGNRDDFIRVLLESFELPPPVDQFILASLNVPVIQNFLACYDGEPAGTAQIIPATEVGGLYSGGVLPPFRRRGIQAALIAHRARAAFDQGLDLLYSGTEEVDNQSSRNLRKQGFFIAYEWECWGLPQG